MTTAITRKVRSRKLVLAGVVSLRLYSNIGLEAMLVL
jgi:hypothetical protein